MSAKRTGGSFGRSMARRTRPVLFLWYRLMVYEFANCELRIVNRVFGHVVFVVFTHFSWLQTPVIVVESGV